MKPEKILIELNRFLSTEKVKKKTYNTEQILTCEKHKRNNIKRILHVKCKHFLRIKVRTVNKEELFSLLQQK